jgi:hypothetical protein
MPFINGRYYANPIMGEALEAAREAEAALLALENRARQKSGKSGVESAGNSGDGSGGAAVAHGVNGIDAPIHRVEIEAAELVPAHSGRATRGYVARVHRRPAADAQDGTRGFARQATPNGGAADQRAGNHLAGNSGGARVGSALEHLSGHLQGRAPDHAETHVFTDHRDLVSFLRDELAKDSRSKQS